VNLESLISDFDINIPNRNANFNFQLHQPVLEEQEHIINQTVLIPNQVLLNTSPVPEKIIKKLMFRPEIEKKQVV